MRNSWHALNSAESYEKPNMHIVLFAADDIVRTSGAPGPGWHWCANTGTWAEPGWSCPY